MLSCKTVISNDANKPAEKREREIQYYHHVTTRVAEWHENGYSIPINKCALCPNI